MRFILGQNKGDEQVDTQDLALQNKEYSVTDVCFECGYNSLVHFNKSFKSILHTTPSEYKKAFLLTGSAGAVLWCWRSS